MPTKDKLFTIVLPVRNGGSYVRDCVASILAQEDGDFDFHILDNASTDGTLEWLLDLKDPRVVVTPSAKSLSIEENWGRILQVPKNEYLTTIGHDDLLDPDFFSEIRKLIQRHPDAGLYLTHFRLIDRDGSFIRHCRPMPERETAAEYLASRLCFLRESFGTGHVFRSSEYDAAGGIPLFPKLLSADDALFIKVTSNSYRATSPKDCFAYRYYSNSTAGASSRLEIFSGLEAYAAFLKTAREQDPEIARVLSRHFSSYVLEIGMNTRHDVLTSSEPAEYGNIAARIKALASTFSPAREESADVTLRYALLEKAETSGLYRMLYRSIFRLQYLAGQIIVFLARSVNKRK